MIGLELRGRVTPVLQQMQEQGVLALPAGGNVLRLLPPLIITRDQLQTILGVLQEVLDA
jgi:acetylornithine/LysW-gamma-L-lysine aminotransferase